MRRRRGAEKQRVSPRRLILLGLLALGVSAPPASAIQIGISDQHASMFSEPLFAPLHMRYGRLVVKWNVAMLSKAEQQPVDDWLAGAAATGVEPHVAFGDPTYAAANRGKGPTPAKYKAAVRAFHKRWPQVRVFTPWNEETHSYEPTFKKPELAARYYEALKSVCPTCQVVAADLLDLPNMKSWLARFLETVRGEPRLWGLHNYRDANRNTSVKKSWTLWLAKHVKGTIWASETGGITGLEQDGTGQILWSYSPTRAAKALKHLFTLLKSPQLRSRVQRVYVYSFYGTWDAQRKYNRWDSGLVGTDLKPRPAYDVLKNLTKLSLFAAPRR